MGSSAMTRQAVTTTMSSGSRARRSAPYRLIAMFLGSSAALRRPPRSGTVPPAEGWAVGATFARDMEAIVLVTLWCIRRHERIRKEPDQKYQHEPAVPAWRAPVGSRSLKLRELCGARDAEDHSLDHPEEIGGGENDAQRCKGRRDLAPEERPDEHQELADKAIGAGKAERGQGKNHQERGIAAASVRPVRHCRRSAGCGCAHR